MRYNEIWKEMEKVKKNAMQWNRNYANLNENLKMKKEEKLWYDNI